MLSHFINLLADSWSRVLTALSTSTLAIILFSLAAPVATFFVTLGVVSKTNPEKTFVAHLKQSIIPTLIGFAVPLVLLTCVFGWKVVGTVYDDHQTVITRNQRLVAENNDLSSRLKDTQTNAEQRCEQANGREIIRLKRQLDRVCYRPDRKLTDEERQAYFKSLEDLLRMRKGWNQSTKITFGCSPGDLESCVFRDVIRDIFMNAGWLTALADQTIDTAMSMSTIPDQGIILIEDKDFAKYYDGAEFQILQPFRHAGIVATPIKYKNNAPPLDSLILWFGHKP